MRAAHTTQTASSPARSRVQRLLIAAICLTFSGPLLVAARSDAGHQANASSVPSKTPTVLFLCPHGAAKSVLASAYFQRLAKERGLTVRVDAAGTDPDDTVSPAVAQHLQRNGYTVPVAKPRAVTKEDVAAADVVISLGCEMSRLPAQPRELRRWDEVPGPSEDLKGADEAIRRRVTALVEELLGAKQK
jgi:arsenate reductase (thioredoxin)